MGHNRRRERLGVGHTKTRHAEKIGLLFSYMNTDEATERVLTHVPLLDFTDE